MLGSPPLNRMMKTSNKHLWFVKTEKQDTYVQKNQEALLDFTKSMEGMELDTIETEKATVELSATHTLSPEVFLTDDNIINTQESVELDVDLQTKNPGVIEADKQEVLGEVGKQDKEAVQIQERRSERPKKTANLTTMEKTGMMAQKRNLEGNSQNSNSFAALSNNDIVHITSEMGIAIENDNFETCNLLNALETARNDLYMKQMEKQDVHSTVSVKNETMLLEAPALIWIHDESSEEEDFILVESRKKKRQK